MHELREVLKNILMQFCFKHHEYSHLNGLMKEQTEKYSHSENYFISHEFYETPEVGAIAANYI